MKNLLFILFIGLTALGCSTDDNASNAVTVIYHQTYCSDPWEAVEDNSELAAIITNFFASENIVISHLKIDAKGTAQDCLGCGCLTGKRVILKVHKYDLDAIKAFRFEEYDKPY
ncbi:hypothetical protein [Gelidibacter maritimus]|uniref:Lipoprotein n=1 Tax=Gelidibacter maritimus TaxID=2761487 RepID=A0A7W2R5A6_9FLAO|nr:hypothetical protein [Gelidibacter maritimus]MBA6154736.1 hypothetical protein [Gelidibacter maritimus]